MPSPVWNHFTRSQTNADRAKCMVCGLWMSCRGTTSSMLYHLRMIHQIDCQTNRRSSEQNEADSESNSIDIEESSSVDVEMTSYEITNVNQGRSDTSCSAPEESMIEMPTIRKRHCRIARTSHASTSHQLSHDHSEAITTAIAKMVAIDMLPLSFSENRGFSQFMDVVQPGYNIPGKKAIENRIEEMYVITKKKVESSLRVAHAVALTTDAWSSRAAKSYITVTAHALDPDWKPIAFTLETLEFEDRHTAVNLREYLEDMAKRWNLNDKIVGVVHDNAHNVTAAVRGSESIGESVPCFAHTLQCAVNAGLAGDGIKMLIERARSVVGHFKHSNLATAALLNQQRHLGLPKHRLIQSCRTRWNSTYAMFERLLEQQRSITAVLDDRSPLARTAQKFKLDDTEWEDMRQLEKLLKPFERATTVMSAENGVTLSMTRPLVHSLINNFLKRNSTDSGLALDFKTITEKELRKRFLSPTAKNADSHKIHVTQLAMVLDPRYKTMPGENEDDKTKVLEKIFELVGDDCPEYRSDTHRPKTKKPTVLDYLFIVETSQEDEEMTTGSTESGELDAYLAEADIDHNYDPLKWWRDNEARYPMIAKIARKYLAVPATSTPAERVFSTAGNIISAKRNCLSSEHIDVLIFLYQNRHLM